MRETALFLSALFLFSGTTHASVPSDTSVPYLADSASIRQVWSAAIRSKNEELYAAGYPRYTSYTRTYLRQMHIQRGAAVAPSPRVATLSPVIDQKDIELKHKLMADQGLRLMPERCQKVLQKFYVRYDNPEHRGLSGKSTMILAGHVPDDEFRALFFHEFGHVFDLGCLVGTTAGGGTNYKDRSEPIWGNDQSVSFYAISWLAAETPRPGSQPEDFVSGYASWDMFEDFAESFVYYMLHREVFAQRAQENPAIAQKYNWFRQHLPGIPVVAKSDTQWSGTVPWDITKLAYEWMPPSDLLARR